MVFKSFGFREGFPSSTPSSAWIISDSTHYLVYTWLLGHPGKDQSEKPRNTATQVEKHANESTRGLGHVELLDISGWPIEIRSTTIHSHSPILN